MELNEKENKLFIPSEVYGLLTNNSSNYGATEVVACFETFPTYKEHVAEELGWKNEDFDKAYKIFCDLVRPYVPDVFFEPPTPFESGMGALDPAQMDSKNRLN